MISKQSKRFCLTTLCSLTLLLGLTACQTGYRAKSILDGLGYEEQQLATNVYGLSYRVNATTSNDTAIDLWHMRAAELCGHEEYFADVKMAKSKRLKKRYLHKARDDYDPYIRDFYKTQEVSSYDYNQATQQEHITYRHVDNYPWKNVKQTSKNSSHVGVKFPVARGKVYCDGQPLHETL
ncbi:CC0125/CC1285 family lipoprotein [Agaribacter flavus]|uniref:Lipoprotein n=1 Tax=Agaribacter flavus TaxID=1902781 RepID=A0ABV7FXQ1_9ALTE